MRRLVLPFAVGLLASCFRPPDPDVLFSCDPDGAPACPEDYSCEDDGCCHKNGSDVEASLGACRLAPGTDSASTFVSATDGTDTSGTTDATGTDTAATTDTGPATTSEGTSTSDGTSTTNAETSTTDASSSTDAGSSSTG